MGIVEQAARVIDPSAFEECITTGENSALEQARITYRRGKALLAAEAVLKMAAKHPDLKGELVKREVKGWRDLGVPIEDPGLLRIIERKYD